MSQPTRRAGKHRRASTARLHRRASTAQPRRLRALGVVLAVLVSLLAAPFSRAGAAPAPVTVGPTDDASVSQADPRATSNGRWLTTSGRHGARWVTYLKFAVPPPPEGTTGVRARIVLERDRTRLPRSVEVSAVASNSWSERTVTMSDAPVLGDELVQVRPRRDTVMVSLPLPEDSIRRSGAHSFAVTSDSDDIGRFYSQESDEGGPRLVLTYLHEGNPNPPGDGDLSDTWIGAAASEPAPGGGTDFSVDVFNESDADIGPLIYRRSFDTVLPSSFQQSTARDDAANGYRSFVSWKPPNQDFVGAAAGKYDGQVTAWARSVPTTGVYATSFHEPENDMTGPQFVALQRHLYTVVKAANPSIKWGPVYMAYWWDDGTSHYVGDKDAWWPGNEYADFTAVDVYSNDGLPLENHPEFRGWYDYMLGTGEQMIIAEYGQYVVKPGTVADPAKLAERARIIAQDAEWLAAEDTISMWLYWDAMGDKGDWRLNDETSQEAWRDVSESGRGG